MKSVLYTIIRITIIFLCTCVITLALLYFLQAYLEVDTLNKNSAGTADFIWQIVLLGFVAGASIFTIPKNKGLSLRQTKSLFLAGCCSMASSGIILIGFCASLAGAVNDLWLLRQGGALVVDSGIFLMCWGISMTAVELSGVILASVRKFYW